LSPPRQLAALQRLHAAPLLLLLPVVGLQRPGLAAGSQESASLPQQQLLLLPRPQKPRSLQEMCQSCLQGCRQLTWRLLVQLLLLQQQQWQDRTLLQVAALSLSQQQQKQQRGRVRLSLRPKLPPSARGPAQQMQPQQPSLLQPRKPRQQQELGQAQQQQQQPSQKHPRNPRQLQQVLQGQQHLQKQQQELTQRQQGRRQQERQWSRVLGCSLQQQTSSSSASGPRHLTLTCLL
jgi:hypothetical protein